MARVRKTVLTVGTHLSPEGGKVVVTPERLAHWVRQLDAMRAAGLKIPVPWGHHNHAVPAYDSDSQFLASRYNAGYLERLIAADGRLIAEQNCPGLDLDEDGNVVTWAKLPDGRSVKTAIGEVSLGIAKHFRDGRGRVWNDVITHVALTPHPVWANQDGFQALGGLSGQVEGLVTLALAPAGGSTMDESMFDADLVNPDAAAPPPPPGDDDAADAGQRR